MGVQVREHFSQSLGSENAQMLEPRLRDNQELTEGEGGIAFWAKELHPPRLGGLKVHEAF